MVVGSSDAFAASKCKLAKVIELPITMDDLRPTISATINGKAAKFLLDSGAFYSMISAATASEYELSTSVAPYGLTITGIGGSADVRIATVKEFSIAGVSVKNVEFLVGGSEVGGAGLLGQNLLEKFDVEYDLEHGAIRLFRSEDCDNTVLAYWLAPDQPYSYLHIEHIDALHPHTIGAAAVNGHKIRVEFDTGAYQSMLSLKSAARAGVTPDSPGVVFSGYTSGIGRGTAKQYIAPFASFQIGDSEEIRNTKLRIADIDLESADMLLGADFFVSHRIFVANREHKVFLSYNGGPVFKLPQGPAAKAGEATDTPSSVEKAADDSAAPADAAEWARRGSALAARRDFTSALAALSNAIELRPDEPEYHYERANAYWSSGEPDKALVDYDDVISLKPDFLSAYLPRAQIKLEHRDVTGAISDLESVDRMAPKSADLRLNLAEFYLRMDRLPAAIEQYSQWIDHHPVDSRLAGARAERCLSSALLNQDLPKALGDCNAALRHADRADPNDTFLYVDRGLVYLRQGNYAKAVADFDDALKLKPDNARALYGRAVAEARRNDKAASDADLKAARSIAPNISARFERYGITP